MNFEKTFTGVVSTLTLVAAVLVYTPLNHRRELSYQVVSQQRFDSGDGGVSLALGTRPLNSAIYTIVRISNTGDVPIRANEFDGPIVVEFAKGTEILTAKKTDSFPQGLPVTGTIENNQVKLTGPLMNDGSHFDVQVVTTGNYSAPRVTGVAEGINGISYLDPYRLEPGVVFMDVMTMIGIGVILGLLLVTTIASIGGGVVLPDFGFLGWCLFTAFACFPVFRSLRVVANDLPDDWIVKGLVLAPALAAMLIVGVCCSGMSASDETSKDSASEGGTGAP
ncbi:hypothetical protein [Paraburkholderia youngii]|uniref:hypothetical protein n=1 Tax=Paraburkholderia youngii TaxID=2782701 RepID=UPI003D1C0280